MAPVEPARLRKAADAAAWRRAVERCLAAWGWRGAALMDGAMARSIRGQLIYAPVPTRGAPGVVYRVWTAPLAIAAFVEYPATPRAADTARAIIAAAEALAADGAGA